MKRTFLPLILCLFVFSLAAQSDYYFPPLTGTNWETKDPAELNWCPDKLDSLHAFLEEKNTRSFIVLHKGKIVLEYYYDGADEGSFWYLASAGKSVIGFMVGMAQEMGFLDINDQTSDYLGEGWTDCPPEKEELITIWNQITMTSGLDDDPPIGDPLTCLDPECLVYLADAGTRWAYHNGPYRLTQEVLELATGIGINMITNQALNNKIGSAFFWLDHICWGKARDAARFGLLTLNKGVWDTDTLMFDQDYYQSMISPSQDLNKSYGYLWWLNGQESFMLPGSQIIFPGAIIPDGPTDMAAALGLNDQKIYVVPSLDMVVIRQGDAAGDPIASVSSFDNQLWVRIMDLDCETVAVEEELNVDLQIVPQPASDYLEVSWENSSVSQLILFDLDGEEIYRTNSLNTKESTLINTSVYAAGLYVLKIQTKIGTTSRKVLITH